MTTPATTQAGTITRTVRPPATVRYAIAGELTMRNRQELKMQIVEDVANGVRAFAIDLGECRYIDSSGLGVLVSVAKKIEVEGGTLVLEQLNEDLATLFELTKIDSLFTITRASAATDV